MLRHCRRVENRSDDATIFFALKTRRIVGLEIKPGEDDDKERVCEKISATEEFFGQEPAPNMRYGVISTVSSSRRPQRCLIRVDRASGVSLAL